MSFSLCQLDDLIDALHANAADLVLESGALLHSKAFARAFALAHIAREELSKAVMLQATALKVLAGAPVDWKGLMRRFRNHEDKLKLEGVVNATFMSGLGAGDTALTMLKMASGMAKYRNERKNAALYVELSEGVISAPKAQFTEQQAWRTWKLAEIALLQQSVLRQKLGRFDAMDKAQFVNFKPTTVEELLELDSAELLKRLGAAHALLIGAHDDDAS